MLEVQSLKELVKEAVIAKFSPLFLINKNLLAKLHF
jgi:hypothetical protein